jgi:hypothetical protein
MPDEFVTEVAAVLAAKGAELVAVAGKSAMAALVRLVRDRFGRATHEAAVLEAAVEYPDDGERRVALAEVLAQVMIEDPIFAERVRLYWRDASVELTADRGGVVNHFSGSADKVVQARDIVGDISF